MKHQYFGDINDYRKYGILRALAGSGLKSTICWMLTENDRRTDGRHIHYLHQPEKMRLYDPTLFDALHRIVVVKKRRTITWIQKLRLIPHSKFHSQLLTDAPKARLQYFKKLKTISRGTDVIFFDPDNGLEVNSTPPGKTGSHKYLYWDELLPFWKSGCSLLIYQHFPRVNRARYIRNLSITFRSTLGAKNIVVLKTSTVAFFLLLQPAQIRKIFSVVDVLRERWKGMIEIIRP